MPVEDFLYRIGELVDSGVKKLVALIKPSPSVKNPPNFKYLGRLVKGNLTPHEFISLKLQLAFLIYLALNLVMLFIRASPFWIVGIAVIYFLYLRYILVTNREFLVEYKPYRFFYCGISVISFAIFLGYLLVREIATTLYYYYAYLIVAFALVMGFRWHFKRTFGRDYTYGVVEEVKNDMVRVFIHDDIAANVKPGYYWLPIVPDAEPGRVVKVLVEDRAFRSARPVRIIEVYLSQSSQSSTEPKNATE